MSSLIETVPKLNGMPLSLAPDSAVEIEVDNGVLLFRISKAAQQNIEELLEKQKKGNLTEPEEKELDRYEEIDDYLSFLNRLTRNMANSDNGETNLAA